MSSTTQQNQAQRIKFFRLLLVLLYDSLALVGLLFLASIVMLLARMGEPVEPGTWWFNFYLIFTIYLYFAWCWHNRGGQTLGLKSWKAKVVTMEGEKLGWQISMLRFVGAILSWLPLGLGYLWMLFDKQGLTWHDRLSGSQIIMLPKEAKKTSPSTQSTDQ